MQLAARHPLVSSQSLSARRASHAQASCASASAPTARGVVRSWSSCSRRSRGLAVVPRASFLPDAVEDVLQTGTLIASGLAILGTAALAIRTPPLSKDTQRQLQDENGFEYGVMGTVSCIPLVNWTAWVLPALTNPERSPLYLTYCLLYATPLLLEGFDVTDKYCLAMLALGALHVQVERIAVTEPHVLKDIAPLRLVLGGVATVAAKLLDGFGALLGIVASDTKRIADGSGFDGGVQGGARPGLGQGQPGEGEGGLDRSFDELELKQFDRQLMERERAKRAAGRGGDGSKGGGSGSGGKGGQR